MVKYCRVAISEDIQSVGLEVPTATAHSRAVPGSVTQSPFKVRAGLTLVHHSQVFTPGRSQVGDCED